MAASRARRRRRAVLGEAFARTVEAVQRQAAAYEAARPIGTHIDRVRLLDEVWRGTRARMLAADVSAPLAAEMQTTT